MRSIFFKKKLLIAVLALASSGVMAQENGNRDEQNRIVRGPYETNRFFDNIFIGVAGGVNVYQGENDSYGSFGKRLAPALDLYMGKWITPSIGARIGYSGINAKGWTAWTDGLCQKARSRRNVQRKIRYRKSAWRFPVEFLECRERV